MLPQELLPTENPSAFDSHLAPPAPIAPPPSPVEHLLPPGATELNTAAVGRPTPLQPTKIVDALLPPGAANYDAAQAAPGAQMALPKSQSGLLRPVLAPGQSPAAHGLEALQVAVRESQKEVADQPEIRKLSDEERSRRRIRRNAVIWSVCLVILFAVFWYMSH